MKGLAIPFEPSWCSRPALFGLRLGEQQVQEPAFSWKPMVAHLAGSVLCSSQSFPRSNPLDWSVFPHWSCRRWKPTYKKEELVSTSMFAEAHKDR